MAKELHKEDVVNVNYAMGKFRIRADHGQLLVKRKYEITKEDWTDKPKQKKMLPKFMYQPDASGSWQKDFDEWLTRSDIAEYLKTDYLSPEVDKFIFDNKVDECMEKMKYLQGSIDYCKGMVKSLNDRNEINSRACDNEYREEHDEILKLSKRVSEIELTHNKFDWVTFVACVLVIVTFLLDLFVNK